jgi:hypothetical protein
MLHEQVFQTTENFNLQPLDDFSSAFVFRISPPSVLLLDQHAWLVLELCNGQPLNALQDAYLSALNAVAEPQEAQTKLMQALETLEQQGLITSSVTALDLNNTQLNR